MNFCYSIRYQHCTRHWSTRCAAAPGLVFNMVPGSFSQRKWGGANSRSPELAARPTGAIGRAIPVPEGTGKGFRLNSTLQYRFVFLETLVRMISARSVELLLGPCSLRTSGLALTTAHSNNTGTNIVEGFKIDNTCT